jgi:hypothetical protein
MIFFYNDEGLNPKKKKNTCSCVINDIFVDWIINEFR